MAMQATAYPKTDYFLDELEHPEQTGHPHAGGQPTDPYINVNKAERIGSVIAGGLLALTGLKKHTLLGALVAVGGGSLIYRGVTGHCHAYDALGVNTNRPTGAEPQPQEYFEHGIHVEASVTIDKPASELYAFWRDFSNLPRVMTHLEGVRVIDSKRSHWVAKAPAGQHAEWDAEIINEEQDKLIAWRTVGSAPIPNAGSVRFIAAPGNRGTEVHVVLDYLNPAGKIGKFLAKLFGEEPGTQVRDDLRHLKQFMEAGEIATTQGQPDGSNA